MKVLIKKLALTNFRNISHKEYNLTDSCCFVGKNHTGKTNSLLAIYWLLTDKLLDGSDNSASLKPIDTPKEKVCVEATLEVDGVEHTIKKEYFEKWTKTRGSMDLTLTGHETIYTIDGIIQKTNAKAQAEINDIIGDDLTAIKLGTKIDYRQAVMNPLYLAETLHWKSLRELVFYIIGEVSNDELVEDNAINSTGVERLKKYYWDSSKALLYTNQQLAGINEEINQCTANIKMLSESVDIPEEEVKDAETMIGQINQQIDNVKNGQPSVNPEIAIYKETKATLEKEISERYQEERNEYSTKVQEINKEIQKRNNDLFVAMSNESTIRESISNIKSQLLKLGSSIDIEYINIAHARDDKATIKEKYLNEVNQKFTFNECKCPNCNYVLNEDDKEKAESEWLSIHQATLDQLATKGKALQLKIDNSNAKINESFVSVEQLNERLQQLEKQLEEQSTNTSTLKEKKNQIDQPSPVFRESVELAQKRQELATINTKITDLIRGDIVANDTTQIIQDLEATKQPYQSKLEVHYAYLLDQKRKKEKEIEIQKLMHSQVAEEIIKESILQYEQARLNAYDKLIAQHFQNVKFVLIQKNIKSESWEPVCYPLIVGKDTPFESGSTSEKAMTGIALIESIKKELELSSLPIVIDECSQLDLDSLALIKAGTESQIVATKVDDNYNEPTLVSL